MRSIAMGAVLLWLASAGGCGAGGGVTTPSDGIAGGRAADARPLADARAGDAPLFPPQVDVHAMAGGYPATSPQTSPAFTTTNADDLVLAIVFADGGSGTPAVSDAAGLSWKLQYYIVDNGGAGLPGDCGTTWIFYARPGRLLSGDTVTASRAGAVYFGLEVVAVANASGFDPNASLPATAYVPAAPSSPSTASTMYSTTRAKDLVLGTSSTCHVGAPTWTGLTLLDDLGGEYSVATRPTTSVETDATASVTQGAATGIIVFALAP